MRAIVSGLVSTVAHLAVLLFMFASASGALVSAAGGSAGGEPMTVTVVSSRFAEGGEAAGAAALLKARKTPPAVDSVPAAEKAADSSMDRMLEAIRRASKAEPPKPPSERFQKTDQAYDDSLLGQANARTEGAAGRSASTGDLWSRVQPCWRDLPIPATIPVSLEISLDASGALSRPPKVIRAPGLPRIEEARLKAEERALTALAACLPRNGGGLPRGIYHLDFGPAG